MLQTTAQTPWLRIALVAALLFFSCPGATGCDPVDAPPDDPIEEPPDPPTDPPADEPPCDSPRYAYLMAFQSCTGDECNDPRNHLIYLAGSDDGVAWALINDFEPLPGSVPELVYYDGFLYLFHTQGRGSWQKLDAGFRVIGEGLLRLTGVPEVTSFVDPSLIVDDANTLHLFFLPGVIGGDPAGCGGTYPCTKSIYSAVPAGADLLDFSVDTQPRVSRTIHASDAIQLFCDPDIVQRGNGFLLYISAGGSTLVYRSDTLTGTYTSPDAPEPRTIATFGGVPCALPAPDGSIWLYVNRNGFLGQGTTIARGISPDGLTPVPDEKFAVVLDSSIFDNATGVVSVGSPSVIAWPGAD